MGHDWSDRDVNYLFCNHKYFMPQYAKYAVGPKTELTRSTKNVLRTFASYILPTDRKTNSLKTSATTHAPVTESVIERYTTRRLKHGLC